MKQPGENTRGTASRFERPRLSGGTLALLALSLTSALAFVVRDVRRVVDAAQAGGAQLDAAWFTVIRDGAIVVFVALGFSLILVPGLIRRLRVRRLVGGDLVSLVRTSSSLRRWLWQTRKRRLGAVFSVAISVSHSEVSIWTGSVAPQKVAGISRSEILHIKRTQLRNGPLGMNSASFILKDKSSVTIPLTEPSSGGFLPASDRSAASQVREIANRLVFTSAGLPTEIERAV